MLPFIYPYINTYTLKVRTPYYIARKTANCTFSEIDEHIIDPVEVRFWQNIKIVLIFLKQKSIYVLQCQSLQQLVLLSHYKLYSRTQPTV